MYKMSLSRLGEPEVGGSIDGYLQSLTAQKVTAQGIYASQTFLDGVAGATAISLARVDNTTDESGNVISSDNVTVDYKVGANNTNYGLANVDMKFIYPHGEGVYWAWSIANSAASGRPVGQVDFSQIPSVLGVPIVSASVAPTTITNVVDFSVASGAMTSVQTITSLQPRGVWKVLILWRGGAYTTPGGSAATIQYFLGLPGDTTGPNVSQTLDVYQTDCSNGVTNNMLTSAYLTLLSPPTTTSITLWANSSSPTSLSGSTLNLFLLP